MAETHPFYSLWAQGDIRKRLFDHLSKSDICAVRLANSACCNLVTRRLFQRIHLTFTSNSFTRPYRVEALARIGHHIEHITFYLPHSEATFLPPLIHPSTGAEICYLYTPHTSMASTLTRPKYGNSELGDILTQQYPPLFHAATNVPSFINAVKNLPNLRHLTIKTPGQNPAERYRRDIVDYTLMSLRIAVERSPHLTKLSKLSLHGVHPAAFLYLKFQDGPGFGLSPMAGKRWRQIRRLHIAVDAWDFYGSSGPGLDQLKIIDDYLRQFSGTLEKLSFTWLGNKGPCPLALAEDVLFETPRENRKLFNEVTSPMSPLPATPGVRGRIRFSKLKYLQVKNASMNESQLRGLVESHRKTVKEFDFDNVVLVNGGNWDEALAPLMASPEIGGNRETWARYSLGGGSVRSHGSDRTATEAVSPGFPEEAFSPVSSRHSIAQDDEIEIRHSAAVDAVGKDLLDLEIENLESFVGLNHSTSKSTLRESGYFDDREEIIVELEENIDIGLDSAINLTSAAASEETLVPFSTKLKKRVRRRRRKPSHPKREDDGTTYSDDETVGSSLHLHRTKSGPSRSQDTIVAEKHSLRNIFSHKRSNSSSQTQQQHHHQPQKLQKAPPAPVAVYGPLANRVRQSSDPMPYIGTTHDNPTMYELPLVIASDDESLPPNHNHNNNNNNNNHSSRRDTQWPRPRALSHPIPPVPTYAAPPPPNYAPPPPPLQQPPPPSQSAPVIYPPDMNISLPLQTDELPVLLQPMVYNPQASTASIITMIPQQQQPPPSRAGAESNYSLARTMTNATTASTTTIATMATSVTAVSSNTSFSSASAKIPNNGGGHNVNEGLSAVQRNLEQEEIQRRFAEDAEARTSALKRAREAVLEKLGRLNGKMSSEEGLLDMHPALQDSRPRCDVGLGFSGQQQQQQQGRLRELFGAVKGSRGEDLYQNVEGSNSALVPLVFSRT